MQNGLTKADTVEMIQAIDLVGLTMTMVEMRGELPPPAVQNALLMMLGNVRHRLAKSYGITLTPGESMGVEDSDEAMRRELSPSDVADQILRDLDGDDNGW